MVSARYDGGDLGLAEGLMFAIDVHLSDIAPGEILEVSSSNPGLEHELPAWCRGTGHRLVAVEPDGDRTLFHIERGARGSLMFADRPDLPLRAPDRTGGFATADWLTGLAGRVPERADPATGFAPRGATLEPGSPPFPYTELDRDRLWAQNVASLYDQATTQQWDAATDIEWDALPELPSHVERAVAQVMTHLAENEYAALYVPSKFIPRIHPHFTEVVMFLATQVVDEARHIEAFTKRALASGGELGLSAAITQRSLKSLLATC